MTCEEIRLVKPTLELEKEALKYRQEHFDFGEQVINGSVVIKYSCNTSA